MHIYKSVLPKRFTHEKWEKTLIYSKNILDELDIKDYVYIKDFKHVENYFGSNVDIYLPNQEDILKIQHYLESKNFSLPRIDFEYDKYMFVPGIDSEDTYIPIHIYPYIGWYTLRLNFLKDDILSESMMHDVYPIPNVYHEVILILFHAYFEDRCIPSYDIAHLNYLIETNNITYEIIKKYVHDDYVSIFTHIFEIYNTQKILGEPLVYKDIYALTKIVYGIKDSFFHKMYYLILQYLKWFKIIRG